MNKTLFATTVLAAGLVVTPLLAAEAPTVSVRGYINAGMYYGDLASYRYDPVGNTLVKTGTDGSFGVEHEGEIHFRFRGSSDNGLTFKGEVEMEAFSNLDQIDEFWTSVSGSFGDFRIGADDTAAEYMELGIIYAPYAKVCYYDCFNYTGASNGTDSNGDDYGVYYITPAISGFTAAISFQPEGGSDGTGQGPTPVFQNDNNSQIDNVLSIGAQYMGEFDGFSFGVSGGYQTSDTDVAGGTNGDPDTWNVGAQVGFGGFTLAAFYEDNAGIGGWGIGGYDVAVGASYETGPWTFAGGWAGVFDTKTNNPSPTGRYNSDSDTFAGWVTYALAPGVNTTLAVEYTTFDEGPVDDNLIAGAYMSISF